MTRRTVFVSYSRKDSSQVEKAVELLEAGGADVFRDLDDIQYGDRWEDVIRNKLSEAERVLVFWSTHAQLSEWVEREWTIAIAMQKRVVPILLDQTPLPVELGQFHALGNFMLPGAKANDPATQVKRQPAYLSWGLFTGGLVLLALFSFSVLKNQETALTTLPQAPSSTLSETQPSIGTDTDSTASASPNSHYPPTYPSVTAPEPAVIIEPEPELSADYRTYLLGLSVFLVLLAIIGYLVWKRRQQHSNTLQAGEKLVQAIFQE